jgi:excisionase family DNA binding protein
MNSDVIAGAFPATARAATMNEPLIYTIAEACAAARSSRTALYAAIHAGALRAVKRGRRTMILAEDLRRYLQDLPEIERRP